MASSGSTGPTGSTGPSRRPDAGATEDVALVGRLAERDGAALGLLYDRYGAACYALAARILVDGSLAEDVVTAAFDELWREAARVDRARSVGAWLLAGVQQRAVEMARCETGRTRRTRPAAVLEELGPDGARHEGAWWGLRRERVLTVLERIDGPARDVLALAYFGGYTQREIAGITGSTLAEVKGRLRDAVAVLRDGLDDELVIEP